MKYSLLAVIFIASTASAELIWYHGKQIEFTNKESLPEYKSAPQDICTGEMPCELTTKSDLLKIKDYRKQKAVEERRKA